jgi:hypothetical protein
MSVAPIKAKFSRSERCEDVVFRNTSSHGPKLIKRDSNNLLAPVRSSSLTASWRSVAPKESYPIVILKGTCDKGAPRQ